MDAKAPAPAVVAVRCDDLGLPREQLDALQNEGEAGALRVLYPYDGTVFPRGLTAPLLMWDGVDSETALSFSLRSASYSFSGCLQPSAPGQLAIPQQVWDEAAAKTGGKADPFMLELRVLSDGKVYGPVRQQLIIAPGSLKGSVFYNSYSSALARAGGASGGAVLRIPAGGSAEVFLGQRTCVGCHGASADGTRLVTNEGIYALEPGTAINPPPLRGSNGELEFPGVTPNGDAYAVKGQLFITDTGTVAGNTLPLAANEVSFSASGLFAAFVDGGPGPRSGSTSIPINIPGLSDLVPGLGSQAATNIIGTGTSTGQGKIATMRYDAAARSFSDYTAFKDVSARAQWPVYLPDDKALLFADTTSNDLMLLDLASRTVTPLARAMGFASLADARAGKSALPFENEARMAFYPTIAPVAAGGYFWVYFDSPRRYGNVDTAKIESGLAVPSDVAQFIPVDVGSLMGAGLPSRQLWVAAIEISPDGSYREDVSAPAFFLPGQEIGANNHRAFSALDPCLDNGGACDSGTACCSGFCSDGTCVPPPDRCAQPEEACQTSADCCDTTNQCIRGFCSIILL